MAFDIYTARMAVQAGSVKIQKGEGITHALMRAADTGNASKGVKDLEKEFRALTTENKKAIMDLAKIVGDNVPFAGRTKNKKYEVTDIARIDEKLAMNAMVVPAPIAVPPPVSAPAQAPARPASAISAPSVPIPTTLRPVASAPSAPVSSPAPVTAPAPAASIPVPAETQQERTNREATAYYAKRKIEVDMLLASFDNKTENAVTGIFHIEKKDGKTLIFVKYKPGTTQVESASLYDAAIGNQVYKIWGPVTADGVRPVTLMKKTGQIVAALSYDRSGNRTQDGYFDNEWEKYINININRDPEIPDFAIHTTK